MVPGDRLDKMTEVLSEQNEQRDPRPIGRFLLGIETYSGQYDPLTFATEFAHIPGNFQKYKHKTAKVGNMNRDIIIDGREVSLEFSIARSALIWTVSIAAEKHRIEDLSTGYIPHGGEQYELHCAKPNSHGIYREYDMQRRTLKQFRYDDMEVLLCIQGLVENLVDTQHYSQDK